MKLSAQGYNLIKEEEGLRLTAYQDAVGVLTIGYGHTGDDVYAGQVITEDEAHQLLVKDVTRFEDALAPLITKPLTQYQYDAIVSFVYNIGIEKFSTSTLLRLINEGDAASASKEFSRWVYAGGEKNLGLEKRREREARLYSQGIY